MSERREESRKPVHDRALLLHGPKRNEVLTLREILPQSRPQQSRSKFMGFLVLVVDDEPDVEMLFRQQFRRDLRDNRFKMDFAQSAASTLQRISDAAGDH